jgi:hypothetical protein
MNKEDNKYISEFTDENKVAKREDKFLDSKAICPITFVDNTRFNVSRDINNLFLSPYEVNRVNSDIRNISNVQDKFKYNKYDKYYKDDINRLTKTITYDNMITNKTTILSYIYMNTRDLIYNTLIRFLSVAFDNNMDLICRLLDPKDYLNNIDIEKFICFDDSITISNCIDRIIYNNKIFKDNIHLIYNKLDSAMDKLYSMLVHDVFDKYIISLVHNTFVSDSNNIKALYVMLYKSMYDINEPGIPDNLKIDNIDASTIYSFCTCTLREIMEQILVESFRPALMVITKTASNMIYESINAIDIDPDNVNAMLLTNDLKLVENKNKH